MLLCGGEARRGGCGNFVKQFKFCHKSYEMFPRTRRYWQAVADSTDRDQMAAGEKWEWRPGEERSRWRTASWASRGQYASLQPAGSVLLPDQTTGNWGQASCCELRPNHCIIICLITNSVRSHDTRSWSEPSDLGLAITLFSPLMITGAVSPLSRVVCRAAILTLSTSAEAPPGTIYSL